MQDFFLRYETGPLLKEEEGFVTYYLAKWVTDSRFFSHRMVWERVRFYDSLYGKRAMGFYDPLGGKEF